MKEGKLIKVRDNWYNVFCDGIGIASTHEEKGYELSSNKLSLRNCREIANNYDLDKMATEYAEKRKELDIPYANGLYYGFLAGFDKRNEMLDVIPTKPDPKLIDSMCLRYRHDFGLIEDENVKKGLRSIMTQLWEEVVGLGFYKGDYQWKVNIEWETDEPIPFKKRKVIRKLDNGEEIEWTCFWDNGWWGTDGVKTPNVISWERMPVLDGDDCLILTRI